MQTTGRNEHMDNVLHACAQIVHMAKPFRTESVGKEPLFTNSDIAPLAPKNSEDS